ncbi:hypothetical protein [Xenorhabdus bovienii]|uniref:hypothetical protein n=1 Tax=Xenorhabdus bovienii TaxID=40576 RepID=UPI003AF3DE23
MKPLELLDVLINPRGRRSLVGSRLRMRTGSLMRLVMSSFPTQQASSCRSRLIPTLKEC